MKFSRCEKAPLLVALLIAVSLVFLTTAAWREKSVTFDEATHLMAGVSYWRTGDFRLNSEHPPLVKLLASASMILFAPPVQFSELDEDWQSANQLEFGRRLLLQGGADNAEKRLRVARYPMALLAGAGALFAFFLGRRLWGGWGGVVAAALFASNPNILAHASLITTDVPVAVFLLLMLWVLWDLLNCPKRWKAVSLGVVLGLALATKFSAVFLVPAVVLIIVADAVGWLPLRTPPFEEHGALSGQVFGAGGRRLVLGLLVVFATAALVCVSFYMWPPKPLAYWDGLFRVNVEVVPDYQYFFLGKHSKDGFLGYFPACFLLKTPLPALVLFALALVCLGCWRWGWRQTAFLLVPISCLFFPTVFLAHNIGARYLIPIWALLAVLAGVLGAEKAPWPVFRRWVTPVLLVMCWGTAIWSYPNYISYFNVLAGGPKGGIRFLDDSNVDWGQEIPAAMKFLAACRDPEPRIFWMSYITPQDFGAHAIDLRSFYHERYYPVATTYLISAHWLNNPSFPWLRWFLPAQILNDSVYVYRFALTTSEPSHFDAPSGTNVVNLLEQDLRVKGEMNNNLAGGANSSR